MDSRTGRPFYRDRKCISILLDLLFSFNSNINKERASLETRRNIFHVRVAKEWNKIPNVIKKQKTVNGFKAAYDAWKRR